MKRLIIHVEGQTEETFVREVIAPHLCASGFSQVSARIVGDPRSRGGIGSWPDARKEIVRHLKQDRHWLVSTFVDYYGMPSTGWRGWPGREEAKTAPVLDRASIVEAGMAADIGASLGNLAWPNRFVPFVMLHEYEALLFSDCERFAKGAGQASKAGDLQAVRDQFDTPEKINDSPMTAPSKRILAILENYQKPFLGVLGAMEIGLPVMRAECPHFDAWLKRLEDAAL